MFKHAVADFYLQSTYQYMNKGNYGHPGGILHSAIHVALTPLVYLVIAPASLLLGRHRSRAEFVSHYHIDWLKEQITHRQRLDRAGPRLLVCARHRSVRARPDYLADRRRSHRVCG